MGKRKSQAVTVSAICLALAAMTFGIFGQTLAHGFLNYDDNDYVYENPTVVQGISSRAAAHFFTHPDCQLYHPLTMLSHALACQLFGLNPGGHHLINVLLHTASVVLLFLVMRQMTGALWRSVLVAAFFAIHPLRVESVAWVTERKDVLSGLFFVLSLSAYVWYSRRPTWSRYAALALLFACGLLSKPMLVTLPLVLLVLDYWPLNRWSQGFRRLAMEKAPLFALSAGSCLATMWAAKYAIASGASFPLGTRAANALVSSIVYLKQMFWPVNLAVIYPFPRHGVPWWQWIVAAAFLSTISAVAWQRRRACPWLLAGWLWYLIMLVPVLGIVQAGYHAHADRFTYLPQIGINIAVVWLVAEWQLNKVAIGGLITAILALLMVGAWKQTSYWADNESLWRHSLHCTADNTVAEDNLGLILSQKGDYEAAAAHYKLALQIDSTDSKALNNLGTFFLRQGKLDDAVAYYEKALQLTPTFADAHYNLANAFQQQGKWDKAIVQYQLAVQANANYTAAHVNLGNLFEQLGRIEEAISQFQLALQINPNSVLAHDNLGNALLQQEKWSEALPHFWKALQLQPANPFFQNKLAWLLATYPEASLRDGSKAVELARRANESAATENPEYLRTLAAAYAEAGRLDEAARTAQHALDLAGARSNAGLAGQLRSELKLYQLGSPLHMPAETH